MLATIIVALALFLGTPTYSYEAHIQVEGDTAFQEQIQGGLEMLAGDDTLSWWLAWASLHGVVIHQSPWSNIFYPTAFTTGIGPTKTIVFHPLSQTLDTTATAIYIIHELTNIMDYPDVSECRAWEIHALATSLLRPERTEWAEQQLPAICPQ